MLTRHSENPALRLAIRAALTGGSIAASLGVANAQEAPAAAASDNTLAEVVVTGSRIAVPNETSISPVTFVTAAEIERTGVTRVEDLLNQLPSVFADQTSSVSNGATGIATVDLRGLGAKRTLVLVDGQRLGPGDPTQGGESDINMIPVEMIQSVEVLTGGASAVYGADAVAGVVNFKLLDNFEGVKVIADAGIFQNHNGDPQGVQQALAASGDPAPPSNVWTGANRSVTVIAGLNSPDGNGNATVYFGYRNILPVLESSYSYSACTLGSGYLAGPSSTGGKRSCLGSGTAFPANFLNTSTGAYSTVGPGGQLVGGPALFNFGALNFFQRNDERYTSGAFLHYEFNEHAEFYSHTMFMDDFTSSQVAQSGDFGLSGPFNCSNPFLSTSELGLFCGGSTAGMSNPNVEIFRRNVEGGPRVNDLEHMDIHEVLGMKGKIDDVWSYDASVNYSLVDLTSINTGYFSTNFTTNALNVVNVGGVPTCVGAVNGTTPSCVPYNIFQPGKVTQAALNYLTVPGLEDGRVQQKDAQLNFVGDLGKYGLQIPLASSGLKVNIGAEYRDVQSSVQPDQEQIEGDLAGSGGPTPAINGGIISREGYIEARLPIMDDQPFAKALDTDLSYRYSSYNLGFKTNTFTLGLDFAPTQDVRFRGSFARAVRAPNVVELFNPAAIGLDGTYASDPCSGKTPQYTAAQCARTGVTAAQYGNIVANPAAQYNGLLGGNEDLQPETAITKSIGIELTPRFLPNFRLQVDWFDIHIENVIEPIGGSIILSQCALNNQFCQDIHRNSTGSLWTNLSGYISDLPQNVGGLEERGVDVDMSYAYDLGAFGKLQAQFNGTYIDEYLVTPNQSIAGTSFNCAGLYGEACSGTSTAEEPVFRWRHRLTNTWITPWNNLEFTLAWRYYSPVKLETLSGNPNIAAPGGGTIANGGISNTDAFFSSYSYFDLTAAVKVADHVQVRVGCNNLLDKPPPLIGDTNTPLPVGNGNTFPGVYDALGRFIFAQVTATF